MPGGLSPVTLSALVAALQRQLVAPEPATWRNNRTRPIVERFAPAQPALELSPTSGYSAGNTVEVRLVPGVAGAWATSQRFTATLVASGTETAVSVGIVERTATDLALEVEGRRLQAVAMEVAPRLWEVRVSGGDADTIALRWLSPLPDPGAQARSADSLAAPMPGQVIAVYVGAGQRVRAGEPLLVLEAMEHTIRAPHDGVVAAIHARAGEQVAAAALLVDIRATPAD
jgi:biotin carboxyl carrier protein